MLLRVEIDSDNSDRKEYNKEYHEYAADSVEDAQHDVI